MEAGPEQAALAGVRIIAGMAWLDVSVRELSAQYGGQFRMEGLGPGGLGILAGVGAGLGWFGALISTGRHLRRIEPRA
jgi:cell division protein FtsX